jgi:hypothetical protein
MWDGGTVPAPPFSRITPIYEEIACLAGVFAPAAAFFAGNPHPFGLIIIRLYQCYFSGGPDPITDCRKLTEFHCATGAVLYNILIGLF